MGDAEPDVDVLVITQFFPPESMGGAHRWEKIATNLDESVNPHVVCTFPTFPYGTFDREWRLFARDCVNGVPVTRLFTYQPGSDSAVARVLNYGIFAALSSLYVLLTFWRYDCIIAVSAPHTTFVPGLVGKFTGRTLILDIFDQWLDNAVDLNYVTEDSLAYRLMDRLERLSFTEAEAVFVITETMESFYRNKYPELGLDTHVIPFGVDTTVFSQDVEPTATTDIIYTGNLGTGQAFLPFLEAFAGLDGETTMTFVGGGERRSELEATVEELGIEDRVTFVGYVPRDNIPGLVAGAELSIIPLKTEHQLDYARPTKLLETMAVGTPYVASAVGEIAKLSQEHGTGIAVENEATDVRAAMDELLSNPQKSAIMGSKGVEVVRAQHDWSKIGERVSRVVREVVRT